MILLIKQGQPLDEVIFADTDCEVPETYEFLNDVVSPYLKDYDIPLKIVKSKSGSLYDRCQRRKVIPSQIWRWCTRDFKVRPIYAYYRSLGIHIVQYLGISYEERERMRKSGVSYATNKYPLVSLKLTRCDCLDRIFMAGIDLPVRSGCFICPFNSISRWTEIYEKHNDLFMKAMTLEENSKHFPKQRLIRTSLRELENKLATNQPLPEIKVKSPCSSECLI